MTEQKVRTAWDDVEDAWQLCDQVNNDEETYKDGNPPLAWGRVFSLSPLIDFERTQREGGGNPPMRIFLKTAYGIEFRPDTKKWIVFRHGPVDISNIT
ncbi:MAG: hypothetical protein FJX54_08170 [Alphaproteobacteria bacterium]|nr:hypothetical protein [Alphaproteobacteria bacterium]